MSTHISLTLGPIRKLTDSEILELSQKYNGRNFKYVTEGEYRYSYLNKDIIRTITVPKGFLTDGSTGTPDWGRSWVFHDWLYATHRFDNEYCSRLEADKTMAKIIKFDNFHILGKIFCKFTKLNPFWVFSRAWESSGTLGPIFLNEN